MMIMIVHQNKYMRKKKYRYFMIFFFNQTVLAKYRSLPIDKYSKMLILDNVFALNLLCNQLLALLTTLLTGGCVLY